MKICHYPLPHPSLFFEKLHIGKKKTPMYTTPPFPLSLPVSQKYPIPVLNEQFLDGFLLLPDP